MRFFIDHSINHLKMSLLKAIKSIEYTYHIVKDYEPKNEKEEGRKMQSLAWLERMTKEVRLFLDQEL